MAVAPASGVPGAGVHASVGPAGSASSIGCSGSPPTARPGWRGRRRPHPVTRPPSERSARDVAHALTRFGIRSQAPPTVDRLRPAIADRTFEVEIMDAPSLLRFCDEIGILGKEHGARPRAAVAAAGDPRVLADTVPSAVWDDVLKAKRRTRRGRRSTGGAAGRSATTGTPRGVGRCAARRSPCLAEALDDDQLRWWASPDVDVGPDRVEIEPAGDDRRSSTSPCRGLHNFVAADVYLHNTALRAWAWRRTSPRRRGGRCSCSRWRWATSS